MSITQLLATISNPIAAQEFAVHQIWQMWRDHRGDVPPRSSLPLPCIPACPGWGLRDIAQVTNDYVEIKCQRGHTARLEVPKVVNEIRADKASGVLIDGQPATITDCQKYMKTYHLDIWRKLARYEYLVRSGYPKANLLNAAMVPHLSRWLNPLNCDSRRVMLLHERLVKPAPMYKWVTPDLFAVAQQSKLPSGNLHTLRLSWPQGAFFLHNTSLAFPSGAPCAFIAFTDIQAGFSSILDDPTALFCAAPKLILWAFAPSTMETFTGELTLSGHFEKVTFHPVAKPNSDADQDFLKSLFHVVLILHTTARMAPATVEDQALLKTVRRIGRKHKGLPPTNIYQAPLFGLSVPLNREDHSRGRKEIGKSPRPHWRRGFNQKHHKGPLKGRRETFDVYHPPQFIGGEQE